MNRSQRLIPAASLFALALAAVGCVGGEAPPLPPPVERAKPPVAAPPATDATTTTTTTTVDGVATTTTTTDGAATTTTTAAVLDPAQLETILATADMADGTADKVVSKCAGCKLGMDGKAEHAVLAHGYTLHFCSEACKARSEPDMNACISGLNM